MADVAPLLYHLFALAVGAFWSFFASLPLLNDFFSVDESEVQYVENDMSKAVGFASC